MEQRSHAGNLLLFDAGNTSLKIGIANKDGLLHSWNLPTDQSETADGLGLKLVCMLENSHFRADVLDCCLVSSVVPVLDPVLRSAVERYIHCQTLFATRDIAVPLDNHYSRPEETGADRLVGAYAARMIFPGAASLVVVDFGTAVTFDCVCGNAYKGGLIFPGPGIAASALGKNTAKLPAVNLDVDVDEPLISENTATSITHGLVFGYQYLVEGLCRRLASRMPEPVKIIGTGFFANTIARLCGIFDAVVPCLVLDGLRYIHYIKKKES